VTKELVLAMASEGRVFPNKTTRHTYRLPPAGPYRIAELR
jgi:hypothetical protein